MSIRITSPLLLVLTMVAASVVTAPRDGAAQTIQPVTPTRIPLSGVLRTVDGQPRAGTVLLVMSLYENSEDPTPRWIEQQTVTLDATGRYDVHFGATREEGLPPELFTGASATRWVGVGVANESEQPRLMLISVPYAAKAASADTLGGRAPGEFVLTSTFRQDLVAAMKEEGLAASDVPTANANINEDLTVTGRLVVTGFTAHDFWSAGGGSNRIRIRNLAAGASNFSALQLGNDINDSVGSLYAFSGSYNSSGPYVANGFTFDGGNTGGLSLAATSGAGAIRLYSGGTTERMRISNTGMVGIGTANPTALLHVAGDVVVDGNIGAKYQDVAEWVESTEPLELGSLVVVDSSSTNRVSSAKRSYDLRVAGAVSPQPGIVLGEPGANKVLVAQSGRVRVKADARYGAIRPGDLLVSSATKGHVMRSRPLSVGGQLVHRPGTLVGKALEALPKGTGEILVLLTLQ